MRSWSFPEGAWCDVCHVTGPHSPSVVAGAVVPCEVGPRPTTPDEIRAAMLATIARADG